jgi:hypothetical protein
MIFFIKTPSFSIRMLAARIDCNFLLTPFEELNFSLVLDGAGSCIESPEVSSLPRFRVLFARVKTVLS